MLDTKIQDTDGLLRFLVEQAEDNPKQWFGFKTQKVTGIRLAHEIAARHADKMTPDEIVDFVAQLNSALFLRMIKPHA